MILAIVILVVHVLTGLVLLYAMLFDLGVFHKRYIIIATRLALIGWWLMHLEHMLKTSHFDFRQLISELFLLLSVSLIAASLSSIKKLIK